MFFDFNDGLILWDSLVNKKILSIFLLFLTTFSFECLFAAASSDFRGPITRSMAKRTREIFEEDVVEVSSDEEEFEQNKRQCLGIDEGYEVFLDKCYGDLGDFTKGLIPLFYKYKIRRHKRILGKFSADTECSLERFGTDRSGVALQMHICNWVHLVRKRGGKPYRNEYGFWRSSEDGYNIVVDEADMGKVLGLDEWRSRVGER